MPGQKLDVCRLPRPGLRGVGRQSGRVYPPVFCIKCICKILLAPLRVDTALHTGCKQENIYMRKRKRVERERDRQSERGNIRRVCVDSGNFDKDLNPTCCDFLCGLSLITAAAKENIKRVE